MYERCKVQNNLKLLMIFLNKFFFSTGTITCEVFRETAPRNIARKFGQNWCKLKFGSNLDLEILTNLAVAPILAKYSPKSRRPKIILSLAKAFVKSFAQI